MRMLKRVFIFFISLLLFKNVAHAQQAVSQLSDTVIAGNSFVDSTLVKTAILPKIDTVNTLPGNALKNLLGKNIFLNTTSVPQPQWQLPRKFVSKDAVFYLLAIILLLLGVLRVAYPRYFSNLIRVFFNTSLRQGQLTDQLLQAKLPSLFFNLFFLIITGCYIFLVLNHFGKITYNDWEILLICIAGVSVIYFGKYCTLKFVGWLTGYKQEAETYIFIVFLINKVIAICLVPVIIILPFSDPEVVNVTAIVSFVVVVLMFILRFFRSYGLLQSRLTVSGFQFALYVIGIEILPLFLIYKGTIVIMSKNL